MALTKATQSIVASTSNAAGAVTRGATDVRSQYGGMLTLEILNGATGPTLECVCRVSITHDTGDTPAVGAIGAVWKQVAKFGGGVANNGFTPSTFYFGPEVKHIQVEFADNTGQAVTVEAIASTFSV